MDDLENGLYWASISSLYGNREKIIEIKGEAPYKQIVLFNKPDEHIPQDGIRSIGPKIDGYVYFEGGQVVGHKYEGSHVTSLVSTPKWEKI
jgi:hypothetical protein